MDTAETGIPIGFNPLRCCNPRPFLFPMTSGLVKQNGLLQRHGEDEDLLTTAVNEPHRMALALCVYCSLVNGGSALPVRAQLYANLPRAHITERSQRHIVSLISFTPSDTTFTKRILHCLSNWESVITLYYGVHKSWWLIGVMGC